MKFEIVSKIEEIETIASGHSIRILPLLNKSMEEAAGERKRAFQLLN